MMKTFVMNIYIYIFGDKIVLFFTKNTSFSDEIVGSSDQIFFMLYDFIFYFLHHKI